MLYYIFEKLKDFDIPGQGLMNYLSFRAIAANVLAMLVALFFGKKVIEWLQKKQLRHEIIHVCHSWIEYLSIGIKECLSFFNSPNHGNLDFLNV